MKVIDSNIEVNSIFTNFFFCLLDRSVPERGMLRARALIMNLYISHSSVIFCLTYFEAVLLGACTLRIAMASWRPSSFIIMQCLCLTLAVSLF